MSDLSLRHLTAFVAVAEAGHFGRAATALAIPQPLLSQMILRLEQRIGGKLLLRRPAVRLTSTGETFLPFARRALKEVETGAATARMSAEGQHGHLQLGFPTLLSLSWLPEAIAAYHRELPSVQITYLDLATAEQIQALRDGRVDVGLIRQESCEVEGVHVLPIDHEPLVLVLSSSHRLAAGAAIAVKDLAGEPFILFPRNTAPRLFDVIMGTARAGGLELSVSREARDWLTVLGLVRAQAGFSFIPASLARIGLPGLAYREMPELQLGTTLSLAWRTATENPVVGPFVEKLQAFARAR
jgi:DNA-binding transcriptional LysR family regulator